MREYLFIAEDERIGSCYLEFQFCKSDVPIKNNSVDIDIMEHWQNDSLLISDEDFGDFYKSYSTVFNCALLANGKTGFNWYGPNYYSKAVTEKVFQKLSKELDDEYENLILWLEKAADKDNGFYILGI